MAPTKSSNTASTSNRLVSKDAAAAIASLIPMARKGVTRGKSIQDQNVEVIQTRAKRKADHNSPIKNDKIKRSALGNLTNNANKLTTSTQHPDEDAKQKSSVGKKANLLKDTQNIAIDGSLKAAQKIATRASTKNAKPKTATVNKNLVRNDSIKSTSVPTQLPLLPPPAPIAVSNVHSLLPIKGGYKSRRISNEFNQTEDSLYMSALEDVSSCESLRFSGNFEAVKRCSILQQQQQQTTKENESIETEAVDKNVETTDDDGHYKDVLSPMILPIPQGVDDFDKITLNDPFQVPQYAMDIFNYLKSRENKFPVDNYMIRQLYLSEFMRTMLIDWMVEVQETFELNHETLYLAVKILDIYLSKVVIEKNNLQLLGTASLLIACKFDERSPPLVQDFLYICDGAYKRKELLAMEVTVLRVLDYDIGIPLSYRFLRRYARCAKVSMATLTLARYILELALMDYNTICFSDSRMACAALFMALRLHGEKKAWSTTLEYYSGYKLEEFSNIVPVLNAGMHRKSKGDVTNIRNKYSHKIFHEVAKVELMSTDQLFEPELNITLSQKLNLKSDDKPEHEDVC